MEYVLLPMTEIIIGTGSIAIAIIAYFLRQVLSGVQDQSRRLESLGLEMARLQAQTAAAADREKTDQGTLSQLQVGIQDLRERVTRIESMVQRHSS